MAIEPRVRQKLTEWLRRYLPLEIAGWTAELGGAAVAYLWTGSLAAAAVAATIGSSVGYYLPAYVNAVRWSSAAQSHRPWQARFAVSNALALRSLTVEFGPAELVDTLVVRPMLIYAAPMMLGNVVLGWVVGGFIADVGFYLCAICSYERFKRLVVIRPSIGEVDGEPAIATA
jgi:hypothetical protein